MAETRIDEVIKKDIDTYISIISKHYRIDAVYLFGSHAHGDPHEWSDVDLAIVSNDIKDRFQARVDLFMLARHIKSNIEPHPYNTEEFYADEYILVDEILRTGIRVA